MSAIIENVSNRSQQTTGRFKARAPQDQYASYFCAVEGGKDASAAWDNVRDVTSSGIPIAGGQRGSLVLTEFKDKSGNFNDISYNGVKLRECIASRADVKEKDRREARLSTEYCKDFLTMEDLANRNQLDGLLSVRGEAETTYETMDAKAEPLPRGESTTAQPKSKPVSGWTPERRAAQAEKMRARHAAKVSAQT
jgi:hypothetical protein